MGPLNVGGRPENIWRFPTPFSTSKKKPYGAMGWYGVMGKMDG